MESALHLMFDILRDRLFNKNVANDSNYSYVASECCLISYFDAKKFWCTLVLAILKTNLYSHHLYKCNFIQNMDFQCFLVYLRNDSNEFFLKSLHIIYIMYIKVSETFIKIDSLEHLKISRQTYPTNRSKLCVTTFTVLTLC